MNPSGQQKDVPLLMRGDYPNATIINRADTFWQTFEPSGETYANRTHHGRQ